ncbi:MAG: xylulokinase [Promethearchaeota archaeon]
MSYVLCCDLGTTGCKTALFDLELNIIANSYMKYPLYYPKLGWAEQDPNDFWNAVKNTIASIIKREQINPKDIISLSFTCQMNCTIPIDKNGSHLMNCISWLDTRASETIREHMKGIIKYKGMSLKKVLFFKKHSGGGPGKNGKDPISHYLWIKENHPEIYNKTFKFLSVKDYIIFKCTGNAVTSKDLANTAWLKDPRTDEYSEAILEFTKLDAEKLPEIKKSTDIAGELNSDVAKELGLKAGIPIFVGSGDLTAAALGSGCIREKEFIICLGTADWVAAHVPKRMTDIPHYIGTIDSAQDNYLYISKQETGAACFDWISEQLYQDKILSYKDDKEGLYNYLDDLVENIDAGCKNLIFLPWLFGERSPINDSEVRGGFINLCLYHKREDILRAVYEGIAYSLRWSLDPIEKKLGKCKKINIIGGAANSDIWCQIIADVLNREINRVAEPGFCGTKGVGIISLVGSGIIKSFEDAIPLVKIDRLFKPNSENFRIYNKLYNEYKNIYKRNKKLFRRLNIENNT